MDEAVSFHTCYGIILYVNSVFGFGIKVTPLVAMATFFIVVDISGQ